MSQPVIRVEGLGKEYIIGRRESGSETFREMLTSSFTAPFRRLRKLKGDVALEERFWALKDVCFEVAEGEVVGIIGRNGAGKSTLLKILSRITEPTEGRIEIRGRVASLLEVGTGFHPELTGRENIYLNGAILGMSHADIARKFEEIVDFAEVEKFLDTPVKRYSSGMHVRLAFAVAAHMDPDILVVDEVLAVGDTEFQKRCLGKMREVVRGGRTIIFVSHNLAAVSTLCNRVLLLKAGKLEFDGTAEQTIQQYMSAILDSESADFETIEHIGSGRVRINKITMQNHTGIDGGLFMSGNQCWLKVALKSSQDISGVHIHLGIYDDLGRLLAILDSSTKKQSFDIASGQNYVVCGISKLPLSPGLYVLNISVSKNKEILDGVVSCATFRVESGNFYDSGLLPPRGPFLIDFDWLAKESLASVTQELNK